MHKLFFLDFYNEDYSKHYAQASRLADKLKLAELRKVAMYADTVVLRPPETFSEDTPNALSNHSVYG